MGSLHLVRHGQTTSNVMGRLDTRLPGAGLTDFGARQAVRFALERPDAAPSALFSSYARRARETAGLMGAVWGIEPRPIADLHEVQVGDLEDRYDDASVRAFRELIADWYAGHTDRAVGNSENLDALLARYLPAIEALRTEHLSDASGDIYVVSHGAAIRLAAARLGNVDPGFALEHGLPNTGSIELVWRDDAWIVVHWGGVDPARPVAAAAPDPMG